TALQVTDLKRYAMTLHLDLVKFQDCLESGRYTNEIRKDLSEGQRAGVKGTPTFLIGTPEQGFSRMKALKRIRGAQPYPVFKEVLDSMLILQK
ncbi:MAG: DsbA family protein, partial [Syntrophaceae bacterium]|nr:DsbA family protein [Syntrophaceae bacterium]